MFEREELPRGMRLLGAAGIQSSRWRRCILGPTIIAGLVCSALAVQAQAPFGLSQHDRATPIESLSFTLARRTLSPAEVTVKPGQYQIRLRNGMFIEDFEFSLVADRGRGSATIPMARKAAGTHIVVNLTPGVYELSVAGRPDLKSTITVKQ